MATNQPLTIDSTRLRAAMTASPALSARGSSEAFRKIKDEWTYGATNEAPLGPTHNLRDQINGTSSAKGVFLRDNAINGGFNYSYYIHEIKGNDYLDRTIGEEQAKQILEDEIRRALNVAWGGI